jgi:siroheme decarboxylase
MEILSINQSKAAHILQSDIPLDAKPFTAIADICGMSTNDLIFWIKELSHQGMIRKFGAILRHQNAGYQKNALAIWSVPPDVLEKAGYIFAELPYISHCYERKPAFQDKYNLFTMLHTQKNNISPMVNFMSRLISCDDFLILESVQEYKKTSPEYF